MVFDCDNCPYSWPCDTIIFYLPPRDLWPGGLACRAPLSLPYLSFFPRKLFFLKSKCDPRTPRKEPPRWPRDSPCVYLHPRDLWPGGLACRAPLSLPYLSFFPRKLFFLKSKCDPRTPRKEPPRWPRDSPCVYLHPRDLWPGGLACRAPLSLPYLSFFPRKLFFLKSKCDPRTPRKEPPRWRRDSPMRISSPRGPLARWACVQSSVKPSVFIFFPERL